MKKKGGGGNLFFKIFCYIFAVAILRKSVRNGNACHSWKVAAIKFKK